MTLLLFSESRLTREQSRVKEFYRHLRKAILSGVLKPGARLVEGKLAKQVNISRVPVREALHKLQAKSLVQALGRHLIVAAPTADELRNLCAVREVLEGIAARLAAKSCNDDELDAMARVLSKQHDATSRNDIPILVVLNHRFHDLIWQSARNHYLAHQLVALRGNVKCLQGRTLTLATRRHKTLNGHEQIPTAIKRGDGAETELQIRELLRQAGAARLALGEWSTTPTS